MKVTKTFKKKITGKNAAVIRLKKIIKKPEKKKPAKKSAPIKKSTVKTTTAREFAKKSAPRKIPDKKETPAPLSIIKTTVSKPKYPINVDLPERYNKTYLCAIPKDPHVIFVFWEITEETIARIKETMGIETFETAKPVLRLLDITDIVYDGTNEWKYFDTYIHYYANNWYVKVPEPGRTYMIKYGNLTKEGTLHTLMQSNALQTPCDNVSDIIDEEWSTAATADIIKFSTYPSSIYDRTGDLTRPSFFQGSSDNSIKNSRR